MRHIFIWVVFLFSFVIISGCGGGNAVTLPERCDESGNMNVPVIAQADAAGSFIDPLGNLTADDIRDLPQWLEDEVLIVLHDGVDASSLHQMASGIGLSLIEEVELMWATVYRMRIVSDESVESIIATLVTYSEVRYAEPNVLMYPCAAPYYPDDEMFEYDDDGDPYNHPLDCWYPNVLGASLVWPHTKGSEDVVVSVVDMGIRYTHEDLANRVWINEDEIPDNGIDDDDNGFIDDWRGWDFCDHDNDPWDDWHGTPCAGVIVSEQDNGSGISGVAPGCRVMAVRLDASIMGTTISSLMAGIQYSYDNGADIVSMSLRSYIENEILHETFIAVYDNGNGMLPIGGAGNENASDYTYPCSWPEVIEVGASCSFYGNGQRRDVKRIIPEDLGWGSNYGEHLDVVAPGHWIVTPHMSGDDQYWDGITRKSSGGCSMATPETAACCALMKSYNPDMTAGEIRERLIETCDDLDEPGHDIQTGWGRPNVWRAIFGSDPNSASYDGNGHIPIGTDGEWMFDNLFDMPGSADYDIEDVFVLESPAAGWLSIEMDIITTGEDFEMELYNSPDLDIPIASGTGPNGETNPTEEINSEVAKGQKYYVKIFSAGPNNCSTYRLRTQVVPYSWWIEWESLAPPFASPGAGLIPLLEIEVHTNTQVATLDTLRAYVSGEGPLSNINQVYLYEDSNETGEFESWVDEVVDSAHPSDIGVNQVIFTGINSGAAFGDPLRYFIVADVTPGPAEHPTIGIGIRSYKDITIIEELPIRDDPFPIFSGLTIVGEDNDPPEWDDTTGIQHANPMWKSAKIFWNNATDEYNEPAKYNLYWDDSFPPEINTGQVIKDIPSSPENGYDHAVRVSGMANGETYYFCIRAEDQIGNEDTNETWLDVTPGEYSYPEDPLVIGALSLPGTSGEVCVHEKVAYVTNSTYGIAMVDCTDPDAPVLVDTYAAAGCNGICYHENQGYLYIACTLGLIIIDPHAPGGLATVGSYDLLANATDVAVDGNTCYLGNVSGYLHIIDVTDPSTPGYKGDIALGDGWSVYDIAARDGYAYCCMYSDGLQVVDASDPASPYVAKHLPLQSYLYAIDLWGDYAFVTNYKNPRFYIVDISDPPNAFQAVEQSLREGFGHGIAARDGQYVYVAEAQYSNFLCTYRWDDLGDVHKVGEVAIGTASGLAYDGNYVYIIETYNGLKIII